MTKTTVWILGDQLLQRHPALAHASPDQTGVLLIESRRRTQRLPYRGPKLALLFSAMRHYAQVLRAQGYEVDYRQAETFSSGLNQHLATHQPDRLVTMAASSYDGRRFQSGLADRLKLSVAVLPNTQFLVGQFNPIPNPEEDRRYVMESFYRQMRRHFNILMEGEEPTGGRWNYDKENRKSLPQNVTLPDDFVAPTDEITRAVLREQELTADEWPGYAVTRDGALAAFEQFLQTRLANFGPYEDAMTQRSHTIFHSVLSPYLNLGLLEPMELVISAERAYRAGRAPINSVEGFVRQVLGWREFIYWQYWRQMPGLMEQNAWDAHRPVPDMFWDGETSMACLRHALSRALMTGYNHHIERLMLISNFFMLTGVSPRLANDWFLSVYVDAYDWVMAPNVVGMGLNADDGLTATKPYIASANYINKMSDHCSECFFNHRRRTGEDACPFNFLYWNFLIKHEARLRANPRFGPAVLGLARVDDAERRLIQEHAARFLESLRPEDGSSH